MKRSTSRVATATSILAASAALSVPANAEDADPTAGAAPPDRAPMVLAGADNIYGYEIWNEPAWGYFDEMWAKTCRLIRTLDPDTPIIGPSHDRDDMNGVHEFLKAAKASDTVPDTISWHELGPDTGLAVEDHVDRYREIEKELGIVPGRLTRFVSKLERAEVDTANLAFWHQPGRLGDLLTPVGGGSGPARRAQPNGNYWVFNDGSWQHVSYEPTQFRELVRHAWVTVDLPAGTSTITLAKSHPDYPGETQPGTVDLDYIDVVLVH